MLRVKYNPPKMQGHYANIAFPETKPLNGWEYTSQGHVWDKSRELFWIIRATVEEKKDFKNKLFK